MAALKLLADIPPQGVNERAAYGPLDLNDYIDTTNDDDEIKFSAELEDGSALPAGVICTADGIVTGIPAKDTSGSYAIVIHASTETDKLDVRFTLTIEPTIVDKESQEYADDLKNHVWQALDQNMPVPELSELMDRGVTPLEVYYLLERWATLTIYDAFNLDPPGEKKLLELKGLNEHYNIYDRGCCLVAAPKDLFSHQRTLADGIQAAKVLAQEAFRREWTVELIGFEKLTRAAWVEIQHLGDRHNKKLEVINYDISTNDILLYDSQAKAESLKKGK